MRTYLAADYARKEEMQKYAIFLREHGRGVVSRWHDQEQNDVSGFGIGGTIHNMQAANEMALRDMIDIRRADEFILFTTGELSRGGRHWETGYARGQNKKIVVIGIREHAFHCLHSVDHYDTWEQFLLWNTHEDQATCTQ